MNARTICTLSLLTASLVACGVPVEGDDASADGGSDARADSATLDASDASDAMLAEDAVSEASPDTSDAPTDAPPAPVTAADLLARTGSCNRIAGSPLYSTDSGETATIPLCQLEGAIFWQADMDIDCDGGSSSLCRSDPSYLPDTSANTSSGMPLDASTLPFIVIPLPRTGFDFRTHDIHLGSVAAVIYQGRVVYAIFGDEGPSSIIGEGSNALATALGIDADPRVGGVDNGVTYIVFTGASGVVSRNEDHAEATTLGEMRAAEFIRAN